MPISGTEKRYSQLLDIALDAKGDAGRNVSDAVLRLIRSVMREDPSFDNEGRRQGTRYEVSQQAVVQIFSSEGEIVCLPAMIKNISLSGVLLEIRDKGHVYLDMLESIEHFNLIFVIPGEKNPVVLDCSPARMELSSQVIVGAVFDGKQAGRYIM